MNFEPNGAEPSDQDIPTGGSAALDWSAHYASGDTPWDLGAPHPELSQRLQGNHMAPPCEGARALVPGAGMGHDAIALARRGWIVTAVDLVQSLEAEIAPQLERLGGTYLVANVLEMEGVGEFDLIWDHTFFCAIPPASRLAWGQVASRLLVPGGVYASLVFPVGKPAEEGGPPFGMDCDALDVALGPLLRRTDAVAVSRPLKRRTWREFWFTAEKSKLAAADLNTP